MLSVRFCGWWVLWFMLILFALRLLFGLFGFGGIFCLLFRGEWFGLLLFDLVLCCYVVSLVCLRISLVVCFDGGLFMVDWICLIALFLFSLLF